MAAASRRVVVVTGGSSGIGLACSEQFLRDGYRLAFFGQNSSHVAAAVTHLGRRFLPGDIIGRTVDVGDRNEIGDFMDEIADHWRMPDTLVCSAGISPKVHASASAFADIELEEWNRVLSVNLTGTMLCCQAVLPAMIDQCFGRIVLVGSIAGRSSPKIAGAAYCASKAALAGLTRSMLVSAGGHGVTVNLVAPGRIVTPMTGPIDSPANQAALQRIPVGRLGKPEDIAHAISFLASHAAGFINGAVIDVNGGEFAPL